MTNFTTTTSERGRALIVHEGYVYGLDRGRGITMYFKCSDRSCKGRGMMKIGANHFTRTADHCHPAEQENIERRETLKRLKDVVKENPNAPLRAIYVAVSNARAQELEEATTSVTVPTFPEIKTVMRHEKRKHQPPLPKTISDIDLSEVKYFQGEEFVFKENDIIMITTNQMLSLMKDADCLYMDGTFFVAPDLFCQLYTIHVYKYNNMICCAYFCLPNKTANTYVKMLQMIQQRIPIRATRFQIDYEGAARNAINQVFPDKTTKGCFFHYTQCLWRKVQQIGLVTDYNTGEGPVRDMVRRTAGLPLLKPQDVQVGFESASAIVNEMTEHQIIAHKMNEYCEYVWTTWIGPNALFPQEMWTRYNVPGPRTNNHLEGWHNSLKSAIRRHKPHIYTFIEAIKVEQTSTNLKLQQLQTGGIVSQKKTVYINLENKIQQMIGLYNTNQVSPTDFLDRVGKLLKLRA